MEKERIGIIGAMDVEVDTLKDAAKIDNVRRVGWMDCCEGRLGEREVVIVKCGMGKVNAGICAATLISLFGCTRIINTGVAGSLDRQIGIGDIVISTDAVQHDFTAEAIGYAKGEIPYTGRYAFPADEALRAAALEAVCAIAPGARVYEGRICSGDQFIATKEQKETIVANFGGLCCEMEGAAVAQACYQNGTPFVIIRAISDADEAIEFEQFLTEASRRSANIVRYMVEML